jgi:flagellar FliL protein
MTDTTDADIDAPPPPKKSKLPLILGVVLLLAGAGGGFMAVKIGLIGGKTATDGESHANEEQETHEESVEVAFVALDPMVITISSGSNRQLLRFSAQLDVPPSAVEEVEKIKPRIVDILNGYLRALEVEDIEAPAALMKIRSQMLHRVKIVAGEDNVNDLLVMEFVLN